MPMVAGHACRLPAITLMLPARRYMPLQDAAIDTFSFFKIYTPRAAPTRDGAFKDMRAGGGARYYIALS